MSEPLMPMALVKATCKAGGGFQAKRLLKA